MNDTPYPYMSIKKQYYGRKYTNIYKGFVISALMGLEPNFVVWYPKAERYKKMHVYQDEVIGSAGKVPNNGLIFAVEEHRKRDRLEVKKNGAVMIKGVQIGVIGGIKHGT